MRDLLLVSFAIPALFVLSFGSALLQEKDTFAIIVAAARMQLTGAALGNVGVSDQRWLIRTGKRFEPLDNHLKKQGWVRADQQGPVGVYKRNGHPFYVRFKMYSARYMICQGYQQP
jgi:hypothetical protein